MPLHRRLGNTKHLRHLFVRESGEKTQLHHLCLSGIMFGQSIQSLMQGKQLPVVHTRGEIEAVEIHALRSAAMPQIIFASCVVDQDAAHRLSGGGKKMSPVLPLRLLIATQAQPSFVNESGGLQGLAGILTGHFLRGELAQFLIDQRQEFVRRLRIALIQALKDDSEFAHADSISKFFSGQE